MPWGTKEVALTAVGCCVVGAATLAYRRKQTTAFKVPGEVQAIRALGRALTGQRRRLPTS